MVARVQRESFEKVLRGSGGVFVFSPARSTSKASHACTRTSRYQTGVDLQAALRKEKAVGSSILGVVLRLDCVRERERLRERCWPDLHSGGREPMDTTRFGATSPTSVQDCNHVPTEFSLSSGSQQMDTTVYGAVSPTLVRNSTQWPAQISLSPRSQRMDTLEPPQTPVLADIAAQLQVLLSSMQSIATTVGQLGGQMQSLQAEVMEMKNAENEDDDEFEEHDGFSTEFALRDGATVEATGEPTLKSASVLRQTHTGAGGSTRRVPTVSEAPETIWRFACVVALALRPDTHTHTRDIAKPAHVPER